MPFNSIVNIPAHQLGCVLGFMQLEVHPSQLPHTVLYLVVLQLKQRTITEAGSVRVQHFLSLSKTGLIAPAGNSPARLELSPHGRCGRCKTKGEV